MKSASLELVPMALKTHFLVSLKPAAGTGFHGGTVWWAGPGLWHPQSCLHRPPVLLEQKQGPPRARDCISLPQTTSVPPCLSKLPFIHKKTSKCYVLANYMILICGRMFCVFSFFFFSILFCFYSFSVLTTPSGKFLKALSLPSFSAHATKPQDWAQNKRKKKKFPPPFGSFSFLSCKGNLEMFQKHQVLRID